jgi:RHS repeat-associated protein
LFNGKELQDDLGLDVFDFHARMYDPAIGRTFQLDPHADSYHSLSPYNWVANNPLKHVDPTGMDIEETEDRTTYTGEDAVNKFKELQAASGGGGGKRKYSSVGIGEGSAFNAGLHGENPYEVEETPVKHHNYWRNNQAELLSRIDNEYVKEGLQFFFDYFVGDDPGLPGVGAVSRSVPHLATKGIKALPKLIGPAGDAGGTVLRQIPRNWIMRPAKKGAGTRFLDPANAGNHIRVMRGNPSSPFLNSRAPYTIRYIDGYGVDMFQNKILNPTGILQNKAPSLHVPASLFKF